jgi:hypothetical protein
MAILRFIILLAFSMAGPYHDWAGLWLLLPPVKNTESLSVSIAGYFFLVLIMKFNLHTRNETFTYNGVGPFSASSTAITRTIPCGHLLESITYPIIPQLGWTAIVSVRKIYRKRVFIVFTSGA